MTPRPRPLLGMAPHEPTPQQRAEQRAVDAVLAAIARSEWADGLVLRGSALMRAWYGPQAREPHDIDFVVDAPGWRNSARQSTAILDGVARAAERLSAGDPQGCVRFLPGRARTSQITGYGYGTREPEKEFDGQRLVLPWEYGRRHGEVQVDFAFDERLPVPPVQAALPRPGGGAPLLFRAAAPELALCWKLNWMCDDPYVKTKDLYDTWLLVQNVDLDFRLLDQVYGVEDHAAINFMMWMDRHTGDWDEFRADYPYVRGTVPDYAEAIEQALWPVLNAAVDALYPEPEGR